MSRDPIWFRLALVLVVAGGAAMALHEQARRRAELRAQLRAIEAEIELMHHAEWLLTSNKIEARA